MLADISSRRLLLAAAPLLTASGYGLWIFAPSYPAFALGFALWGAQGALQSGALEALVYEELERVDAAPHYPALMGRATAFGTLASAMATGIAAPVLAVAGFTGVGVASIAAALAAAAVGATLPEHRGGGRRIGAPGAPGDELSAGADATPDEEVLDAMGGYGTVLRTGATIAWSQPALRAAVVLVPAVTVIWGSLDEYLPLLAIEAGAVTETVPLLALLVYVGMALGGLAAGVVSGLASRGLARLLLVAAGLLAVGALARVPAGFVLIALAFGAFQALTVAADARLQAAIDGRARSTITSFAGVITEALVLAVFGAYALGSAVADHATLFACFAALHLLVAAWLWHTRRLPRPAAVDEAR